MSTSQLLENHAKTKRTTKFICEEPWKYEGVEHGKIDAREKIFRLLVPTDSTTEKKDTITGKKDDDVALDSYVNPLVTETDMPHAALNPRLLESAFAKVAGASHANDNKPNNKRGAIKLFEYYVPLYDRYVVLC